MTLVLDWQTALAKVIALRLMPIEAMREYHETGVVPERYVVLLRAVIAEHCPFEPDVAYMPVPRCGACAHWKPWPKDETASIGYCSELRTHQLHFSLSLTTKPDFGCIAWKAKENGSK